MRRRIAVLWQASFLGIAGVLYILFVLPRWKELNGDWSHTLGTVGRIAAGLILGLAALPVVFTLIKSRKPEYGTPALALSLRVWSIVLHVLAGVLIVGTAIAEIWLSLDDAGPWLFGIYGAAAAIALLGAFSFYLSYVAEKPPPPPKPLKSREPTRGRKAAEATEATEAVEEEANEEAVEPEPVATPESDESPETEEDTELTETTGVEAGKLQNHRPTGKTTSRLRRRSRGGVAVDD